MDVGALLAMFHFSADVERNLDVVAWLENKIEFVDTPDAPVVAVVVVVVAAAVVVVASFSFAPFVVADTPGAGDLHTAGGFAGANVVETALLVGAEVAVAEGHD